MEWLPNLTITQVTYKRLIRPVRFAICWQKINIFMDKNPHLLTIDINVFRECFDKKKCQGTNRIIMMNGTCIFALETKRSTLENAYAIKEMSLPRIKASSTDTWPRRSNIFVSNDCCKEWRTKINSSTDNSNVLVAILKPLYSHIPQALRFYHYLCSFWEHELVCWLMRPKKVETAVQDC